MKEFNNIKQMEKYYDKEILKIKDDVDLKELEKFGFVVGKNWAYYTKVLIKNVARIVVCTNHYMKVNDDLIKVQDRLIFLDNRKPVNALMMKKINDEYNSTLFYLIEAGLVEKIKGEEI